MVAMVVSIRAGVDSTPAVEAPAVEAIKGAVLFMDAAVSRIAAGTKAGALLQRVADRARVQFVADIGLMLPESTKATQGALDNQGAGAKGKDIEGQGQAKKKKEDKSGCFRCKQPGHHIDDCPTPFCDLCESVNHATSAYHLLQAPKATAILHGYANEALMFFELPCGAFKAKVENPKLARVTVDGDALTIPEIIDQLRKIVPSDKFNWEVFHFKENIYRVKLPMEEPMYTLPEVWVRVSGLPSDIRSDYLSLWGVGTLFGKTLDVDMAYTRSNKVLRTKIGCLNRKLIPADCDMFIRRGFYKLQFEVEETNGSQEVDMAEVHNGNDGNDDAHNGEHNKEGGNAMDMDPKGPDEGATSNNDGQGGSIINNGIQGMQLHAHHLDEIKIGSINVQLSPTDSVPSQSTLGLPQVGSWALEKSLRQSVQAAPAPDAQQRLGSESVVATCAHVMHGEQLADSSRQTDVCAPATRAGATQGPQLAGRTQREGECAAATYAGVWPGLTLADNHNGLNQQDCGSTPQAGLAVDARAAVAMCVDRTPPQKIHEQEEAASGTVPQQAMQDSASDKVMMTRMQPMIGPLGIDETGSSVPQQEMGNGGARQPGRPMSLDNAVTGVRHDHILSEVEESGSYGLQKSMGMASSMKSKGTP
ncbi:hypothetical protein ACQ4PT_038666 [Festuca glaucescens]